MTINFQLFLACICASVFVASCAGPVEDNRSETSAQSIDLLLLECWGWCSTASGQGDGGVNIKRDQAILPSSNKPSSISGSNQ